VRSESDRVMIDDDIVGGDASYLYDYYGIIENARDGEGSHSLWLMKLPECSFGFK
jgi:hypothetical protein